MRLARCRAVAPALLAVALLLAAQRAPVHAQDACGDIANQIAAEEQTLEQLQLQAVPWLQQAGSSGPAVAGELVTAAAQGQTPILTPPLADVDGATAAQIGAEMAEVASEADKQDGTAFARTLVQRIPDWQAALTPLQPLAAYSTNLDVLLSSGQSLTQVSTQAQAALGLRDNLSQSLAACQSANSQTPALGCGLTYFGLDRSTPQPTLKSAIPALPSGATPGDEWTDATSYATSDGSTVDSDDTYTCTGDGATKVGRTATQTFPDGSTTQWGERDYVGTLWPRSIAPGASWMWQAVQYFGSPDTPADEETWKVTVHDAQREPLNLPQGKFEAIQLHMEEDIVGADSATQHVSWDEWYAQPQP